MLPIPRRLCRGVVDFDANEGGGRSVTFQRDFDYRMLYEDGEWESNAQAKLASLGIPDRVVENFSFQSIMRLADIIAGGKLVGDSYDKVRPQMNRILASPG